jgi:hypothetical protein
MSVPLFTALLMTVLLLLAAIIIFKMRERIIKLQKENTQLYVKFIFFQKERNNELLELKDTIRTFKENNTEI